MSNLLQINSSIFTTDGQSTGLANHFVDLYTQKHADTQVVVRDLAKLPVPHLDGERMMALMTPAEDRTDAQNAVIDYADELLAEITNADAIVLTLPMYNFSISSSMKAYFDHLARAGVSFKYTDTGPVGLLDDKPVYVLATRGGVYAGTELDTQTGLVKTFLAFIGLKDVHFVYAEGLNLGDESREKALADAKQAIAELV